MSGRDSANSLAALSLATSYRTGRQDLTSEFYLPCLSRAAAYDRAVGYFRSTLYCLTGVALSDFALRGGRMRLVCSPQLTVEDASAIGNGLDLRDRVDAALLAELRQILETPENRPVVQLLSTMIGIGALDLRIAYRPGTSGIFHDKVGIFRDDEGSAVSFVGSSNETYQAWDRLGNHEVVEVFRSWASATEQGRVEGHATYFDDLWEGREPDLTVRPLPDVPREELRRWEVREGLQEALRRVRERGVAEPRRPYTAADRFPRRLLPHQTGAVEAWSRDNRGIVKHATGAGKTLTAIAIVRQWISSGRPALIAVPSDLLLNQWAGELTVELGDLEPTIVLAGAGQGPDRWGPILADATRNLRDFGPRVVLSTLQTAVTPAFLERLSTGKHLLVVADEVHRCGSTEYSRLTTIQAGGRLGLSATPERFADPVGTARVLEYFGPVLEPEFGLEEAIAAGRLVPYDYSVHLVSLTQAETDRWGKFSAEIRTAYARLPRDDGGHPQMSDYVRQLLFKRARVVKQAEEKAQCAADIVSAEYVQGQRWLVYCDDQRQLRRVVHLLGTRNIDVAEYHSAMIGDRSATMEHFADRGGVLVAIKCLDEGVDIPTVTHALILASSANPREHIQRRGRVLRTAQGKSSAVVHDLLVTIGGVDGQQSIIDGDLSRAIRFAATARNEAIRQYLALLARQTRASEIPDFEDDHSD